MITRLKSYSTWQTLDRDLSKKRDSLDKLRLGNRLRTDKISALEKDVEETESGVGEARQLYDRITKTLKIEFERFDREKVGDFTMAVRALLNGLMETQRDVCVYYPVERFFRMLLLTIEMGGLDYCALGELFHECCGAQGQSNCRRRASHTRN